MVHLHEVAKYFGDKRALGPVSFEIPRGSTVGFLGLNGVGKTTLLRIIACALRPSAGSVSIGGVDALEDPHEVRKRVGYLPELPPVYGDMTVGDYLRFVGLIKGLDRKDVPKRVAAVEERTHLTEVDGELTRNLSQGYRQRVGVAQAIVHEPELLILDEPTNGLDPVQIREMRGLIHELQESHTILISSHILPEISQTCDRILILNAGEIIASGTEDELSAQLMESRAMVVSIRGREAEDPNEDAILTLVRGVEDVEDAAVIAREGRDLTLRVDGTTDCRSAVCRALVQADLDVVRLDRARRELESVFVELVGGGIHA